jgi:dTDP-4-dehydrorhamnose reductase
MCKVFKKKVKFNEIIYKKNYKKLLATRSINMSMDTRKFSKAFKIKLPKIDNEIKKFYEKYKNK